MFAVAENTFSKQWENLVWKLAVKLEGKKKFWLTKDASTEIVPGTIVPLHIVPEKDLIPLVYDLEFTDYQLRRGWLKETDFDQDGFMSRFDDAVFDKYSPVSPDMHLCRGCDGLPPIEITIDWFGPVTIEEMTVNSCSKCEKNKLP